MGRKTNLKRNGLVIAGYYGFGNAGDELILGSLISRARSGSPSKPITILSNNPSETMNRFGVHAVNRWHPWTWISVLRRSERFLLGGGGLLQESTGPWNYVYYLSLVFLAKLCGCRTEVISLGVDPIKSAANRLLTRWVMNHFVDDLSVRDEFSRSALKEAGVSRSIERRNDPVFDLKLLLSTERRRGIALALSALPQRPQWAGEVSDLCGRLAEQLAIPIDLIVMFPREDISFALDVARASSAIRNVRVWQNPTDLLSWIPQYELVLGTRFHALVLAAIADIPFIGWGTQKKVIALCSQFNHSYWNPMDGWNRDRQLNQIIGLYQTKYKSVILETRMS